VKKNQDARQALGFIPLSYPISGGRAAPSVENGPERVAMHRTHAGVALQELQSVLLGAGLLKQGV
jgi:hypothetical protein